MNTITDTWEGSWTGAATGNTTVNAVIVRTEKDNDPWRRISDHTAAVNAVDIRTGASIAATVAAFNDTDNIGGYTDFFEPVIIRIRGPSGSCIATPMRVEGFLVPTAAYTQAADWTITAITAFAAPRPHLNITQNSTAWIRTGTAPPVYTADAVPAAATTIRLASRIIAASKSDYNDPYARKAAKREFDVAASTLAKLVGAV
jgi:hypothetical protein